MNARQRADRVIKDIKRTNISWVEEYRDSMPWDELLDAERPALILKDLLPMSGGLPSNEPAILALLDCAERDGRTEILRTYQMERSGHSMPIFLFIVHEYDAALLRYLKAGFDPETKNAAGKDAIEGATNLGSQAAAEMLRTFAARRRIDSLLDADEAIPKDQPEPRSAP